MTEAELELGRQLVSALMPHATAKRAAMLERDGRFVHYTSAESGLRIINSKRMWMRNTTCMADFSEVQHGFRTLNAFFRTQAKKDAFFAAAEAISPGLGPETVKLFNGWWDDIQSNTYVASLSEHDDKEDGHGRLSMWRAFGRNTASVALVLRVPLDSTAGLSLNVTFVPVAYFTEQEMEGELNAIIQNLKSNRDFLRGVDRQYVLGALFAMLVWSVVALKHDGLWKSVSGEQSIPRSVIRHR